MNRPPGFTVFLDAYITCSLWSTLDDQDQPLDAYSIRDLAPETLQEMEEDCSKFLEENQEDIGLDFTKAGHDFWLTRNGHGCGFWDGDWPKDAGERLTSSSKRFGEVDLYVGDDGKIYQG